jgi:hypothetical protein
MFVVYFHSYYMYDMLHYTIHFHTNNDAMYIEKMLFIAKFIQGSIMVNIATKIYSKSNCFAKLQDGKLE